MVIFQTFKSTVLKQLCRSVTILSTDASITKFSTKASGHKSTCSKCSNFSECQPTRGDFPSLLSYRRWIVTAKHKPHEPVKVASNGEEFQLETPLQFDIFEKSDNCSNIEVRASKSSAPAESVKWIPFYWCHKRLYFCHTKSRYSTRGATGFSNCWMNLTT